MFSIRQAQAGHLSLSVLFPYLRRSVCCHLCCPQGESCNFWMCRTGQAGSGSSKHPAKMVTIYKTIPVHKGSSNALMCRGRRTVVLGTRPRVSIHRSISLGPNGTDIDTSTGVEHRRSWVGRWEGLDPVRFGASCGYGSSETSTCSSARRTSSSHEHVRTRRWERHRAVPCERRGRPTTWTGRT